MAMTSADIDNLPPSHYLMLEALAARRRGGELLWAFPTRVASSVRKLAMLGLVGYKSGVVEGSIQVWLTDEAIRLLFKDGYELPAVTVMRKRAEHAEQIIEEFIG